MQRRRGRGKGRGRGGRNERERDIYIYIYVEGARCPETPPQQKGGFRCAGTQVRAPEKGVSGAPHPGAGLGGGFRLGQKTKVKSRSPKSDLPSGTCWSLG